MVTPLTHVVLILLALPVIHFLSKTHRLYFFSLAGALTLLFFAPGAFWIILATSVEALVLERLLRNLAKKSLWRQYVPYVVLLNMFYTDLAGGFLSKSSLATLGVAFSVIRIFMTLKQLLGGSSTPQKRAASFSCAAFFLPAIIVGPVFSGTTLWAQCSSPDEPEATTESTYRAMFGGWILSALVSQWLLQLAGGTHTDRWTAPFVMLALFGYLFSAFWGQSLIAESGATLAGFSLPVNFNRPWLATDIRDFWNRWHISMAKFVTQYIFLPMNLRGVAPKIATSSAFLFMGLWHQLRPGYLLWGLAHGALMAFAPKSSDGQSKLFRTVNRVFTLSCVVLLSYVANYAFTF